MIIRSVPTERYTTVATAILRDKKLSLQAKGLYCWLASHTGEFVFSIRSQGSGVFHTNGRASLERAMAELKESGYIHKQKQVRQANGHYGEAIWKLIEPTWLPGSPRLPDYRAPDKPLPDKWGHLSKPIESKPSMSKGVGEKIGIQHEQEVGLQQAQILQEFPGGAKAVPKWLLRWLRYRHVEGQPLTLPHIQELLRLSKPHDEQTLEHSVTYSIANAYKGLQIKKPLGTNTAKANDKRNEEQQLAEYYKRRGEGIS